VLPAFPSMLLFCFYHEDIFIINSQSNFQIYFAGGRMNFTRCKFQPKSASSILLAYPASLSVAVYLFLCSQALRICVVSLSSTPPPDDRRVTIHHSTKEVATPLH